MGDLLKKVYCCHYCCRLRWRSSINSAGTVGLRLGELMRGRNRSLEKYRETVKAKKSADTLRAASEAFEQRGYTEASITDIARAADVSTATLYKHYRSKERLLAAVIGQGIAAQGGQPSLKNPAASMLLNMLIAEASRIQRILEEEQSSSETIKTAECVVAALQEMAGKLRSG